MKNNLAFARRGWFCPGEGRLAAYVDRNVEEGARRRIENHVSGCDHCLAHVAALARMEDGPQPDVPASLIARATVLAQHRSNANAGWRWAAAAVATVCITLAIVPLLRQDQASRTADPVSQPAIAPAPDPSRQVRRAAQPAFGPVLEFPGDGSVVIARDLEFRWSGIEGVLHYEVRVMTDEGNVVWETRSLEHRARLPGHVALVPGRKYYVSVNAYLSQGKTVASAPVGFTIRGE